MTAISFYTIPFFQLVNVIEKIKKPANPFDTKEHLV